jgi:hypothetical protein
VVVDATVLMFTPSPLPLLPRDRHHALYVFVDTQAISQMIGTLQGCHNLGTENYDTLIKKTTQYSAKLLKKSDQCRCVMAHNKSLSGHK